MTADHNDTAQDCLHSVLHYDHHVIIEWWELTNSATTLARHWHWHKRHSAYHSSSLTSYVHHHVQTYSVYWVWCADKRTTRFIEWWEHSAYIRQVLHLSPSCADTDWEMRLGIVQQLSRHWNGTSDILLIIRLVLHPMCTIMCRLGLLINENWRFATLSDENWRLVLHPSATTLRTRIVHNWHWHKRHSAYNSSSLTSYVHHNVQTDSVYWGWELTDMQQLSDWHKRDSAYHSLVLHPMCTIMCRYTRCIEWWELTNSATTLTALTLAQATFCLSFV